ncbi:hypothetical protein PZB75_20675 [Streptomyces sp. AM 4-1-1]|uniref:hypothetical protein n=1 Tax=unclassified Streptomyces TaxID=2593676 RepID=UPI0023B9CE97|nr:hypothetical protein [Streptomyces sp. AM 4-1-1]WEH35554.1 hypothetical protein PZB75_20675 [Streptomyces sp. AM 4-1-1]
MTTAEESAVTKEELVTKGELFERYEIALAATRTEFENSPDIKFLLDPSTPDDLFHLWNLRWTAHGVRMTEQVESWIALAGRRSTDVGLPELGRALAAHARAEAGHEKLMMEDARALAEKWNERAKVPIDVERLIASGPLYSTRKYIAMHEEVIGGVRPYLQIGIEYEIERFSVVVLPGILERCRKALGENGFTFIAEHVEIDQGHTAFNERQLTNLLTLADANLVPLVETGRWALRSYYPFISECLQLAKRDLEREKNA